MMMMMMMMMWCTYKKQTQQEEINTKKANSLKTSARMMREQIDAHESGEKPLEEKHYQSKLQREAAYLSQLNDLAEL
jgi:hypothetical protein